MLKYINKCKDYSQYSEYIPLFLIAILFISNHEECKTHLHLRFYSLIIYIIGLFILYILMIYFKLNKILTLIIFFMIWIILVYTKRCYVFNKY
jgi:hypothetical protein